MNKKIAYFLKFILSIAFFISGLFKGFDPNGTFEVSTTINFVGYGIIKLSSITCVDGYYVCCTTECVCKKTN